MSSTTRARTLAASLVAVLALGGLAACGSDAKSSGSSDTTTGSGSVTVTDAWARESAMAEGDGAAYFTITNGSTVDDELTAVSVSTDIAESAQMHETVVATETTMAGDGMMSMKEVTSVTIPAGGDVHFEPGGYHVMLIELVKPLEVGQTIPLTLTFAKAGTIEVTATVRAS
jgi:copper(I)-binding protein